MPRAADVVVRAARIDDSARCQEIAVAAWEPIYASSHRALGAAIFDHLHPDWRAAKAGQVADALEKRTAWALVACAGDEIVGFATFRVDQQRGIGEIGNNAVAPTWQGRGIAAALYDGVLERFRQQGLRVAKVTTGLDEAHAPARAAYDRAGFSAAVASVTLYREL